MPESKPEVLKTIIPKALRQYGARKEHAPLMTALDDFMHKKITQEELYTICMIWSYNYALKDLAYKPLPEKPYFIIAFERLSIKKQMQTLAEGGEKVKKHYEEVSRIKIVNMGNKGWLEEMVLFYEKEKDEEKLKNIRRVLNNGYTQNT